MSGPSRPITSVDELDSIKDDIESVHDGWYSEGPIDWEDFLLRLERSANVDLPEQWDDPVIKRIKSMVRKLRAASA